MTAANCYQNKNQLHPTHELGTLNLTVRVGCNLVYETTVQRPI